MKTIFFETTHTHTHGDDSEKEKGVGHAEYDVLSGEMWGLVVVVEKKKEKSMHGGGGFYPDRSHGAAISLFLIRRTCRFRASEDCKTPYKLKLKLFITVRTR